MNNKKSLRAAGVSLLFALAAPAQALDGVAVEVGNGNGVDMARIALQSTWKAQWLQRGEWHVGGYWDFSLGQWDRNTTRAGENGSITEIGLTPVFRFQRNDRQGPYAEAGIGFHFLSHTSIGDRRFGTSFQFGDHVGVGYRFGVKGAYDLGYRYQHLSNASIKQPNNGINFHQVRLQYHF